MKRFSKEGVAADVFARIAALEAEFGFDPNNGSDQVKAYGRETVIAYGAYSLLRDLVDDWGLK